MKLIDIEIERFRSVKEQTGSESIEFQRLNCLVGENNSGKTNILSAVRFLLEEETKQNNSELFWQKRDDETVEVRGYFEITSTDLDRINKDKNREKIENILLEEHNGHESVLAVCRQFDGSGEQSPSFKLLQKLPVKEELKKSTVEEERNRLWKKQKQEDGFSKSDYRAQMERKYEDLAECIPEDKRTQKGIWIDKFPEFIESNRDAIELALTPTDFPSGTKSCTRDQLLPEIITIPAVKEMDSTTKRGGEVGELIDAISEDIQEELNADLEAQLEDFEFRDHQGITQIESRVTRHLGDTFDDREVSFDFPSFSMDYIFSRADIKIEESHLEGPLSKENVGEGVKRTLIFSLLRTLADIQQGDLSITDDEDGEDSSNAPPLLILYEEAELYLYPQLQKQLLAALSNITDSGNQVIFSTHSPVLIDHNILDTINIVRKNDAKATTVTQFHTVLEREVDKPDRPLVTDLNSVSEYIFSNEMVLVEGACDRIVLEKLAPYLNEEWDFRTEGIPIMEVGGKSEVTRFHNFLSELGITTYSILDIDAVKNQIEKISDEPGTVEHAEELKEAARTKFDDSGYSHHQLSTAVTLESWENAFDRLQDLEEQIRDGEQIEPSEADMIAKVLDACETEDASDLWDTVELESERLTLVEALLDENVLLLSGEIEGYYPRDSSLQKREAALDFTPDEDYGEENPTSYLQELNSTEQTDLEAFLEAVFS
ncbi:AAA family ATPase [Haloarcula sp. AONF1]